MAEITRGLESTELERLLTIPPFTNRIRRLGAYTVRRASEGGFTVTKRPDSGVLHVSRAILPTVAEQEEVRERHNSMSASENDVDVSQRGELFDPFDLHIDARLGQTRRDIVMDIHSHPDPGYSGPSVSDFRTYESLRGSNPRIISGVLTANRLIARLMFYHESDSKPFTYFHESLNYEPSPARMIELLHENGFNTSVAPYDMQSGALMKSVDAVVGPLYS